MSTAPLATSSHRRPAGQVRRALIAAVCVGAMAELARRMQAGVKATPRRRKAADTALAKLVSVGAHGRKLWYMQRLNLFVGPSKIEIEALAGKLHHRV